jgi:hypothetical protein
MLPKIDLVFGSVEGEARAFIVATLKARVKHQTRQARLKRKGRFF